MAGEIEYQWRTPDANTSANPSGGSVVTTTSLTGGAIGRVNVTGFPASLVIQPGDLLWHTASSGRVMVTARAVLNGSGAGAVYGISSGTTTWTAADALQVRRPLPSAITEYFTDGGIIIPTFNSAFNAATPAFDLYMRSVPATGLNLYISVAAKLRGAYVYSEGRRLLLRNWADTSTIETFSWDDHYADGYGSGTYATDGTWYDFDAVFQVTNPSALTDWRYKAKFTHAVGGGNNVAYVAGVSVYWAESALGSFRWSYRGACHKAWDFASDTLFDSSEPLVNYIVRALESDQGNPYALGAVCDLRHNSLRATPKIIAWRRQLEARSTDLPLPELVLDNHPATLTRQLVSKGSV